METDTLTILDRVRAFPFDLATDLVKLGIGAVLGWLLKVGRERWKSRRARRFWQAFLGEGTRVVVGRFRLDSFEPSGLLGVGDALALGELRTFLIRLGGREPIVQYADELSG